MAPQMTGTVIPASRIKAVWGEDSGTGSVIADAESGVPALGQIPSCGEEFSQATSIIFRSAARPGVSVGGGSILLGQDIGLSPTVAITRIRRAERPVLEGLLTSIVWITANVAYRSCVREGERGFKRFAAFWLGWPGTFVSAFSVRRGKRVAKSEIDELAGEKELLMEIRRDRAHRIARGHRDIEA
jgi:hypothetical protein